MEPKPPVLDFMKPSRGKEKGKDAEPSKFSIRKSKDAKADPAAQSTLDKDAVYSVVSHMERTLFIVDLSKLEAEGDTLIGSLVMYRPYYEFKKSQYEQRCSQLIGLSLCMKNLTGKYPKYLHLKGTGFAIQSLGSTYIMGLSSRPDEPGSCVVSHMKTVYNCFRFYYNSPDTVMQASQGNWEVFTTSMSDIFNSIMDHITADQHSVPAMLKPLPYLTSIKKNQQVYMLSMRVLQTCQKHLPILGGCIMYNSKLVVNQFVPSLMEMLILIGSGGLQLDKKSILEDNVAPGKVWVLEVYLTREEVQFAMDLRKDLKTFQKTYASMDVNPNLSNSTLHWRFQSSISTSKSLAENVKSKKSWRRKSLKHKNRNSSSSSGGRSTTLKPPVASSTPSNPLSGDRASVRSEEAIMFSPGLSSVSFDNVRAKERDERGTTTTTTTTKQHSTAGVDNSNSTSQSPATAGGAGGGGGGGGVGNDTDELYLDAVDRVDVDPTSALGPEMLRLFSRSTSNPNGGGTGGGGGGGGGGESRFSEGRLKDSQVQQQQQHYCHGTGSTSSEGFATPSPTPPRTSTVVGPDMSSSFKTACDSSLRMAAAVEGDDGGGVATTEKATPTNHHHTTKGAARKSSHPTDNIAWNFDKSTNSESDDDFVDSEDIDKILQHVANDAIASPTSSSPPPPIPKRANPPASQIQAFTPSSSSHGPPVEEKEEEETPPTPPVRGNSVAKTPAAAVTAGDREETPPPPVPPRLFTREGGAEGDTMVTGVLGQPEGYPYLPLKEGASQKKKKVAQKAGGGGGDGAASSKESRKTWIYGNLGDAVTNCDDKEKGRGGGGGGEGVAPDGGNAAMDEGSTGHSMAPRGTGLRGRLYEEIDDGDLCARNSATAGSSAVPPKPLRPERHYEEIDDTDLLLPSQAPSRPPIKNEKSSQQSASKFDDKDYEEIDDSQPSAPKFDDEGIKPSAPEGIRPSVSKFDDKDYEEIDDSQLSAPKFDDESIKPSVSKFDVKPSASKFDDRDYEEIDDEVVQQQQCKSAATPPMLNGVVGRQTKPFSRGGAPNSGSIAEEEEGEGEDQDIGNAALYLENDDEIHDTDESKTSSMTVTLDLSHIAKEDIIYTSRDKKTVVAASSSNVNVPRMRVEENGESSAEEAGGDGTVTPVEMTYSESMLGLVKAKLEQQKQQQQKQQRRQQVMAAGSAGEEAALGKAAASSAAVKGGGGGGGTAEVSGLNDSGEYRSLPEDDDDENVFMNSHSELEDSLPDPAIGKAREKAKAWLSKTMDRRNTSSSEVPALEKYCVYVQQYMNTFIVLLAESGLQHQHTILNQLWRLLAEQLISLDMSLGEKSLQAVADGQKPAKSISACTVSYSGYDSKCEAQPLSAAYHFRHAVRRVHQEYCSDPSLRQISLSKEHCRVLSQCVHGREIYYQPGKLGGDALSLHGVLEKQAKQKMSLRQQPIGGPKVMFI